MVYTILISIVFIAELIIAITVIQSLLKFDKAVVEMNTTLIEAKPTIKEIAHLGYSISGQFVEFAERFVEKFQTKREDFFLRQLSKVLITLLLVKINSRAINKFRKTKLAKVLGRGLSLLENMI